MNALIIIILALSFAGSCLIVAGVFVLVGFGWALVTAGTIAFAAAAILRSGLMANG